jgi:hypothetical protein
MISPPPTQLPPSGPGQQPPRRRASLDLDERRLAVGIGPRHLVDPAQVDHDPAQAAVADQQVGAAADEVHGDPSGLAAAQQRGEGLDVGGAGPDVGGATQAQGGVPGHGLVEAQLEQRRVDL